MKTTSLYIMAVVLLMVGIFLSGCTKKAKNVESVEQVQSQQQEESQSEEQGQGQEEISDTGNSDNMSVQVPGGYITASDELGWKQYINEGLGFRLPFPEDWKVSVGSNYQLVFESDDFKQDVYGQTIKGGSMTFSFDRNAQKKSYADNNWGIAEFSMSGQRTFLGSVILGGKQMLKEIYEGMSSFYVDEPKQIFQKDVLVLYLDDQRLIEFKLHTGGNEQDRYKVIEEFETIVSKFIIEDRS